MKKVNIINFNFDFKVKVLLAICTVISAIIISFSFYIICINHGDSNNLPEKILSDINEFASITKYEGRYTVTVNSNKNSNTYTVCEDVDIENGEYNYCINDILHINISKNGINISKDDMTYQYFTEFSQEDYKNFISFSSIIDIISKLNNSTIEGNIKKIEENENVTYIINTKNDYISQIYKIEIIMSKYENLINCIKMYNLEEKEQYNIKIDSFTVKK